MLNPVQKAIVNDIDLDRLTQLVEDASIAPALGFEVTTKWDGQFRSESHVGPIRFGNGVTVIRDFVIKADEPEEILGSNQSPNPQELLMAALNACMTVGYVAQCAVRGIVLEKLEIETEGDIDLRGFLGIDPAVPPGYENLRYVVRIKGSGSKEDFAEVHQAVMATSPNFYNVAQRIALQPTLVVE